ncbi:MAG: iron-sulfur cluster assembly accessory protein [Bacteroidota bacterium]
METLTQSPVAFTANAIAEIQRLMNDTGFDNNKHLRIGVKGGGCSGMTYVLEFDEKKDGDADYQFEGLSFIMQQAHELYLCQMEIDWQGGLNSRGFIFKNPNASSTCGCGTSFAV